MPALGAFGLAGAPPLRFELTAVDRTAAAFAAVQRNLALTSERLALVNRTAASVFAGGGLRGLSALGGAFAAAAVVDPLVRGIKNIVDEADHLVDTADKIGITTKALQELHFAARQTGVGVDQMDEALSFFSRALGQASRGSGDLYAILQANNVAIRDQDGRIRPLADLLLDYADLVRNAGSSQERTTLVTKAFGRANDELINTLAGGRQALIEFGEEAQRHGAVMEDGLLRRSEEIADRWDKWLGGLETRWKSFVLTIVDGADQAYKAVQSTLSEFGSAAVFSRLTSAEEKLATQQAFLEARLSSTGALPDIPFEGPLFTRSAVAPAGPATVLPELDRAKKASIEAAAESEAAWRRATQVFEEELSPEVKAATELFQSFGNMAASSFADAIVEGKKFSEVLDDLLKDMARLALETALRGSFAALIGQPASAGQASSGLLGMLFHGGGVVGSSGAAARALPRGLFALAPRLHAGLAPDEFPAILQRGEEVITRRDPRHRWNGGGEVRVTVVNRSADVEASATAKPGAGGVDIEVVLDAPMARLAARPGTALNRVLKQMGASMPGVRRS